MPAAIRLSTPHWPPSPRLSGSPRGGRLFHPPRRLHRHGHRLGMRWLWAGAKRAHGGVENYVLHGIGEVARMAAMTVPGRLSELAPAAIAIAALTTAANARAEWLQLQGDALRSGNVPEAALQ